MLDYRFGGRDGTTHGLDTSDDLVVVRSRGARPPRHAGRSRSRSLLRSLIPVVSYPEAGVEVLRLHPAAARADRGAIVRELRADRAFRFAGAGLVDAASRLPVVYTENLFVRFHDGVTAAEARRTLRRRGLRIKRRLGYAGSAWFVQTAAGTGCRVFEIAAELLDGHPEVDLCHPELLRDWQRRAAFPGQWHLRRTVVGGHVVDAHVDAEAAWGLATGVGAVIAVIDDGIDVDHVEFRAVGGLVAPWDATRRDDDPRPRFDGDNHGTPCAGVACAAGVDGASGVAPAASLMPLRIASGLGSQDEADAFVWAADHGADVISCSWGPVDGPWWLPDDPRHGIVVPLPDSTRLAIEYAATRGRAGRGCVVVWAAGNGGEPVDRDGYASDPHVLAVGACNDRGRRSVYSDYGAALWCVFPSDDVRDTLTPGIWTTDRTGAAGLNPGDPALGHPAGDYINDFGGTSSAAPGVAGLAALLLSAEPDLDRQTLARAIADSCDRIDTEHGGYDDRGHSPLYGFGRVNALRALRSVIDRRSAGRRRSTRRRPRAQRGGRAARG